MPTVKLAFIGREIIVIEGEVPPVASVMVMGMYELARILEELSRMFKRTVRCVSAAVLKTKTVYEPESGKLLMTAGLP